ncbi:MAG: hypothetical protein HYZ54_14000 [Ignavibacteriae bacterium]|nr:hypothetical protein [Ignavibacteriota bacterium]
MRFTQKYLTYLVFTLLLLCYGCTSPYEPCAGYCQCKDGKVSVSNIVRWSGSEWISLGSGVNGLVERITADSAAKELYVFGRFTTAGGIQVNGQAKWSEKTHTWSAIGTQFPKILPSGVPPIILPINGHVFVCNLAPNKLYNPDSSFLDKSGLYKWDGQHWSILLELMPNEYDRIPPMVLGAIGDILYIAAQIHSPEIYLPKQIYLFDLQSNKITDSITEYSENFIFHSSYDFKFFTITNNEVFIDEGEGVFNYQNSELENIISITTKGNNYNSLLTANSDYVCLWNNNIRYASETKLKNVIVFDRNSYIFNDSILIPFDSSQHLERVMALKVLDHSLFIGGAYYLKEGSADVRNIGAYDLRQKKWYDLAGGVCGPVDAITEMNGSIYVGGAFTTAGKK